MKQYTLHTNCIKTIDVIEDHNGILVPIAASFADEIGGRERIRKEIKEAFVTERFERVFADYCKYNSLSALAFKLQCATVEPSVWFYDEF